MPKFYNKMSYVDTVLIQLGLSCLFIFHTRTDFPVFGWFGILISDYMRITELSSYRKFDMVS